MDFVIVGNVYLSWKNCLIQESMDDVGDSGLGGNLMFLPSSSMQDKLTSIWENNMTGDDA